MSSQNDSEPSAEGKKPDKAPPTPFRVVWDKYAPALTASLMGGALVALSNIGLQSCSNTDELLRDNMELRFNAVELRFNAVQESITGLREDFSELKASNMERIQFLERLRMDQSKAEPSSDPADKEEPLIPVKEI